MALSSARTGHDADSISRKDKQRQVARGGIVYYALAMFRLIRALIMLGVLGAVAYFVFAVPLGNKTLWQHLGAIAETEESHELVEGVKQKAGEVEKKAKKMLDQRGISDGGDAPPARDELTDDDKQQLRKLIRRKIQS